MSIYSEDVNERLFWSKQFVDQINHAKSQSNELRNIQTIALAGMLAYYGPERFDDIYFAFLKTNFILCDESIENLVKRKISLSSEALEKISKHCQGTFYEVNCHEFINKQTKKRKFKFDRNLYVQSDGSLDYNILLRSIIHQVNHVLNSIHNPVISAQGSLASRMGLSYEKFVNRTSYNPNIEECINELQTDDIMRAIYSFSDSEIIDPDIKRVLDTIIDTKKDFHIDSDLVEIIKPLYDDAWFQRILIDKRISGELSGIRTDFDSKTEDDAYTKFLVSCEFVSCAKDEEAKEEGKEIANQFVKKYVSASEQDM